MKLTITALRMQGDECQKRAQSAPDRTTKAEWVELSTRWHWLARQLEFDPSVAEEFELV